jgi:hypothetical protein
MEKDKVYDLSLIAPKSNDIEVTAGAKDITEELKNYTIVPLGEWDKIPYKTFIRYKRSDGKIPKGGYLMSITHTNDSNDKDILKIDMSSSLFKKAVKWFVYSNSIEQIWKRNDSEAPTQDAPRLELNEEELQNIRSLSDFKDDVIYCKKSIEIIKQEIQKLSNEQMRIVSLIKKLHKLS